MAPSLKWLLVWMVLACVYVAIADKQCDDIGQVSDNADEKSEMDSAWKELGGKSDEENDSIPKRLKRRSTMISDVRRRRDVKTLVDALKANTEMLENVTSGVNNLVKWSSIEQSGYTDIKEMLQNLNPAFVSLFVMLADVALSTSPRFAKHQEDLFNISRFFRDEIKTTRDTDIFDDNVLSIFKWYANPHVLNLTSCVDYRKAGIFRNGVYNIKIPNTDRFLNVSCDQETDGGGWLVIQRRLDGSEDFLRPWADYERGFGDMKSEFWLGNEKLHYLTRTKQELRVDIMDFNGNAAYAKYSTFSVGSASEFYKMTVSGYSGTAGDAMSLDNGGRFYVAGQGNNCVNSYKGPWWRVTCLYANLNGIYFARSTTSESTAVAWYNWHNNRLSLKKTEMKIRPVE